MRVVAQDGIALGASLNSRSSMNNSFTAGLYSDTPLPEKAKIIAKLYKGMKAYTIPFKLENVSLLEVKKAE